MKAKITKHRIDSLISGAITDTILSDALWPGFTAQRLPSGKISYAYRHNGKWLRLGLHGEITPEAARKAAQQAAGAVAGGSDPFKAKANRRAAAAVTVNDVLDSFMQNHVRRRELRSARDMERRFERHVRKALGNQPIADVTRPAVIALCDRVAETAGTTEAHVVWVNVRQAFNFWALRDPSYVSPLNIRGVAWIKKGERARSRVLSDDEIRDLRKVLDGLDPELARFTWGLLLSGRRRSELANMVWDEVDGNVWTIPAARSKNKSPTIQPVIPAFAALLDERRAAGRVFQIGQFSKNKNKLDAAIAALREREGRPPMAAWCWHDVRRTHRTLLARVGVADAVAERILGHQVGGLLGQTYNRWQYVEEMRSALERLAALIDTIVTPASTQTVVQFVKGKSAITP